MVDDRVELIRARYAGKAVSWGNDRDAMIDDVVELLGLVDRQQEEIAALKADVMRLKQKYDGAMRFIEEAI